MTAGETLLCILRRTGLVLGALFLMSVLLAAMPGHRAPNVVLTQEGQKTFSAPHETADMPGTEMEDATLNQNRAVQQKTGVDSNVSRRHMKITSMRQQHDQDSARAKEIPQQLRDGISR